MNSHKTWLSYMRGPSSAADLLATLLLGAFCSPGQACLEDGLRADGFQGRQFEWENDMLAGSDRYYTNGLRLSWVYCERPAQQAPVTVEVLRLGKLFLGDDVLAPEGVDERGNKQKRAVATVYQVGHNLYTPRYIVRTKAIENGSPWESDRPWSGLAYAGVGVFGYRGKWYHATDLKLGVSGRGSGAAWVQREWHRIIGSDYPEGWEGQTERRWLVQMGHMRIRRFADTGDADRVGFHLGAAVNVGTVRSYGTVLAGVTAGWQPGPNPVFAVSNEGDMVIQDFGARSAFDRLLFFANLSATLQATNHLITGRTRGPRPDVDLRRSVGALQVGVSLPEIRRLFGFGPLDNPLRVLITRTARTADFDSPLRPGQTPIQRTDTLSLNWQLP